MWHVSRYSKPCNKSIDLHCNQDRDFKNIIYLFKESTAMEEEQTEELTTEDIVEETDDALNILIELLIKKGVISEQEWDEALNADEE